MGCSYMVQGMFPFGLYFSCSLESRSNSEVCFLLHRFPNVVVTCEIRESFGPIATQNIHVVSSIWASRPFRTMYLNMVNAARLTMQGIRLTHQL
jgi:hypothetical protein